MATLDTVVQRKLELQQSFLSFRQGAIALGKSGTVSEYIFPPNSKNQRLEKLIDLLIRQGRAFFNSFNRFPYRRTP